MNQPVITVTDLHRSYGRAPATLAHRVLVNPFAATRDTRFEAVRGVSFELQRGELFALLGTNGAGKTSTVEVLEGLAPAGSGRVRVLGLDPWQDRRALRPRIGVMLQEAGFPDGLSVQEMAAGWAGTLPTPRGVAECLELVDLTHRRGVSIANLSGGERRRLDLALALLGRPEVLFLDEPTTGLDPQSRRAVWELISGLLAEGTTVLLTTHYLEEAEHLADRIAIMNQGRIALEGGLADLLATQPATITFRLEAQVPAALREQLLRIPGASADTRAESFGIKTFQLQRTLGELLSLVGDRASLLQLEARPASLEQTFLTVAEHRAATASDPQPQGV